MDRKNNFDLEFHAAAAALARLSQSNSNAHANRLLPEETNLAFDGSSICDKVGKSIIFSTRNTFKMTFTMKLMNVLNSGKQYHDILSWSYDGKAFVILDIETFQEKMLPSCFGLLKFSSFLRKLYCWGFCKSKYYGSQACPAFSHPDFLRGHVARCTNMASKHEDSITIPYPSTTTFHSSSRNSSISHFKPPNQLQNVITYFGEGTPTLPKSSVQFCCSNNHTSIDPKQYDVAVRYDNVFEDVIHDHYIKSQVKQKDHTPLCLNSSPFVNYSFFNGGTSSRYDAKSSVGHEAARNVLDQHQNKYIHLQQQEWGDRSRHDRAGACPPQVAPALRIVYAQFEQSRRKHDEIISLMLDDLARRRYALLCEHQQKQQQELLLLKEKTNVRGHS